MKKIVLLTITILVGIGVSAQTPNLKKMKFISANSDMVDIRVDNNLYEKAWTIVPSAQPDVYEAQGEKITFITDLDSITFQVEFGKKYDFVIKYGNELAWTQIQRIPSYIETLKQAGKYEKSDTTELPHFSYETSENGRLKSVREYFKLDSVAGNGNEISKVLNIMYWLHNNVRHDGSNWALCEFDAIDFYNYHKATGKGINCRHLAISLNEMYLSMGCKSRYVTCLPQSETDQDCHVINTVWIDSLQKWIWIDPTFAAYVKDENGNFLGIDEVRERLINDKPLILNEDANWNNESKQTVDNYLKSYMAKNLYCLQVPLISKFNPESRYYNNTNTYISLLPQGYSRDNNEQFGTITHDSEYFWQKP